MKNFIIAAFIVLNLNTALADNNLKTYLKGGIGFNYIRDNKFSNHDLMGKMRLADHFPLIEVGIGTYLTDDIRADLVVDYYFVFKINEKYILNKIAVELNTFLLRVLVLFIQLRILFS